MTPQLVKELVKEFEYINGGLCIDEMSCEEIQIEMYELCLDEGGKPNATAVMVLYQFLVAIGVETRRILHPIRVCSHETLRFGLKHRSEQLEVIARDGMIPARLVKHADLKVIQPSVMPLFQAPVLV